MASAVGRQSADFLLLFLGGKILLLIDLIEKTYEGAIGSVVAAPAAAAALWRTWALRLVEWD